jgi:hypothetical protein
VQARKPVFAVLLAILIVAAITAIILQPVNAQQICTDPATGAQIPCPPGEKKTKRPTAVPPSRTSTPTATHTPTATPTISLTPTPTKPPQSTVTPSKLCLSLEEFKKCIGNPQCQPIPPLCVSTPTPTPSIPLSPFPPGSNMVLGIVLLGGGLLAGVWLAARRAPGRNDGDGLGDAWEQHGGIDMNTDGHINENGSDSSSSMRKPPDGA